jgi:hypothetical protein
MDVSLERLLNLVKAELKAVDARIEIGGATPTDPKVVWTKLQGGGARLVAVLDSPVRAETDLELRLANLARGFGDTLDRATRTIERSFETFSARDRLDSELSALAKRSGAERAAVFDVSSPMVWGASLVEERDSERANQQLEGWIDELRNERTEELRGAHGHVVRMSVDEHECLAKMFGGIYVVALFFTGTLSEPVAVGALLHAAGTIERLVMALPPVDPPPGGKVIRLPKRQR